jgi:HEAT repeat protein
MFRLEILCLLSLVMPPGATQRSQELTQGLARADVRRFVAAIRSGDEVGRSAVVDTWRVETDRARAAIPFLKEACAGEDAAVAFWSFTVLRWLGAEGKPSMEKLVRVLRTERDDSREWAVALLTLMGPSAVAASEALAEVTKDENGSYGVRMGAAMALESIGPGARGHMVPLLEAALMPQRGLLSSMPTQVYLTLQEVLGKDAIPFVLRSLGNKSRPNKERAGAARILGVSLGQSHEHTGQAYQTLAAVLTDDSENGLVRAESAQAIGRGRLERETASKILPFLQKMSRASDASIRSASISALGGLGSVSFPVILELIDSADKDVLQHVCWVVKVMREDASPLTELLVKRLKHEDPKYRLRVICVLKAMGEHAKQALPSLIRAEKDADPQVSRMATEAVRRVSGLDEQP